MSTVEEIESAIEKLPPEKVREVMAWLESRAESESTDSFPAERGGFPLFGILEAKITYHEGWDEPMGDKEPLIDTVCLT